MVNILMVVFVAVAGALNTVQSGANAQLARSLDRHWASALAVSLVTATCFLLALLVTREGLPEAGRVQGAPWWSWAGGACGAAFVTGTLFFAGRLGSGTFTAVTVTAGILTSLVLDHFGLVGFQAHPAGAWRILGGLLMVAGVVLVARF
jgi:transporter family-2 protein